MAFQEIGPNLTPQELQKINTNFQLVQNSLEVISGEVLDEVITQAQLIWKEPVNTFEELATAYPTPEVGWTSMARDDGKVYRHNGTSWAEIQQIDASPINELDSRLTGQMADKATKQELLETVGNISEGTPLFAPNVAGMTDITRNYVNTTDGLLYTHNGTNFVSTGVQYQSTGLADDSVGYSKLDFLITSRINLLDKTKVTSGYLNANGTINTGIAAQVTDFIPVENGDTLATQAVGSGAWGSAVYDANKVFIRKFDTNKIISITDANAKFIRIVYYPPKTLDFDLMVVKGSTYPDEYIPFREEVEVSDSNFNRLLKSHVLKEKYVNLMDLTNYYANEGISTTTGQEVAAAGVKRSWFLPVEFGKLYVGNFQNFQYGAGYDENKNYLCSIMDAIAVKSISDKEFYLKRSDVKYIRVSFLSSITQPYVIESSFVPTIITDDEKKDVFASEKMRKSLKKELNVNQPLSGLKWNAIGDSITAAPGFTRNYRSILAEQENLFIRNYGISGTRISLGAGGTAGQEMATRYANMDNDADIVTVFGGINDMNNNLTLGVMSDRVVTTFYGALHVLLKGLHEKYKGKRIGFITPLNYGNTAHIPYHNAIHEVCAYYSIPVLDLYKNGLINTVVPAIQTDFIPDGLHPNELGHDVMARKIREFLLRL